MSKGLEALKFLRRNYCILKREREWACDTIEKELIALDIIKKRISPLGRMSFMPMSQEEYEILKEVLS